MKRRTFFASALALFTPVAQSYTYDWAKGWTDDPSIRTLPYGTVNRISLNGTDVSEFRITRLRTGSNGYIEYVKLTPQGEMQIDAGGYMKSVLRGHVKYWVQHA